MRILMLNNEFPPLGGGMGTVNRALLQCFAHVPGLAIDLITSAPGTHKEVEVFAERIRIFKVPVKHRNLHHASNRELLTYTIRALPLAYQCHRTCPYDLCFAWSTVPAGVVALALRRLTRLPYLVRVCGPDIPGFERRYKAVYSMLSPAIRAVWGDAEAVVAKCKREREMIHAADHRVEVSLIANGVDLAAFRPSKAISDHGPLRLLCVARLIERKGQQYLIEAVKRLTNEGIAMRLDLVGTGDTLATLVAQARALGIEERVRFVGYVPREMMAAHYAAAHVFVLPSYNEGMSVATLEAMASGLPIIVTRACGTAELITERVNGLSFDWADVDTLTSHLRCLATNRALARRMGAASRVRAEAFSWHIAVERYLDVFAKLLGQTTHEAPVAFKLEESRTMRDNP